MTESEPLEALKYAEKLNPGPWIAHSLNVGHAARLITQKTAEYDPEKAHPLGANSNPSSGFSFQKLNLPFPGMFPIPLWNYLSETIVVLKVSQGPFLHIQHICFAERLCPYDRIK